jgi:prophage regulatory protein
MSRTHEIPDLEPLVFEEECREITGLHPSTRWRLEKQGKFPRRIKVGNPVAQNGRIAWDRPELRAWLAERKAARAQ